MFSHHHASRHVPGCREWAKDYGLTTTDTTTSELNFDTRRLSNFIIQLNISLRLVSSYPKNHPIIASSLHKVLHLLELLLEFRSDITVGVARDTLMVEFALLDSKNPVYRSLAKALFDHDIAAITFTRTSSIDDLLRFSEIMAWKREVVRESGGIEKLMNTAGVSTIAVNGIKYDLFSTTEEETIGPVEHNVETHVARVILQIMQAPPESCLSEPLERNLLDLVNYFLEMGDFAFLADLYTRLRVLASSRERSAQPADFTLLEFFASDFFVGNVLDSLTAWDKSKQPEIRELVCTVGSTFCQPLLNRLAEEQNRSRRRSYLGCLFELGEIAKNAAIERLSDTRWYFVRNLILILRELEDPSILQHICNLAEHPHPKVRMEVIRALQHFKHPAADQLLLQDLSSPERDVQLNAVTLAENSRNHEVFRKLLACLVSGRPTGFDLEMKKSIVRTLAKIGNYEALPTLMQYLETRHLLRQAAHTALKTEIIQSLRNYPAAAVLLLDKIAGSDNGELSRIARETLTNLHGEA